MTDLPAAVRAALQTAEPDELAATVRLTVGSALPGARGVEIWLVDYRQTRLYALANRPSDDAGEPLVVDSSPAGRCYATQEQRVEEGTEPRVHVPISARGDRIGVLSVRFAEPPDAATRQQLTDVGEAIGHALVVASRATDLYTRTRRRHRLTVAAEIQWQLLPGRSNTGPAHSFAGSLEPAYSVAGDSFDWTWTDDTFAVSVLDGTGRGVESALVSALAIGALRNARRLGAGLSDQASLADQAVFAQYGGDQFVSTLLLELDLRTGALTVVDAGSPQVLLLHDGEVRPVVLDPNLPLGMFEETHYDTQQQSLAPGDRLVVLSDGVSAARSPTGVEFGSIELERMVRHTRLLSAAETVRLLMGRLLDHHEGQPLRDDAVAICLDWHPRGRP